MNYFEIGQRIRKIRKAKGISQETLAESVGISTTHMSHIETANTKLSLPVFVAIAEKLEIPTDMLLYDEPQDNTGIVSQEIRAVLNSCTSKQARIIADVVKAVKQSFDAYM